MQAIRGCGISSRCTGLCANAIALLCAFLAGADAAASEFETEVWLNPGFFSYHFEQDLDLREDNWGIGVEVMPRREHVLMAGTFINSDNEHSRYAGYQWRPLQWKAGGTEVRAGIAIAALDGYPRVRDGGWYVAPLPILAVEGERFGLNLTVVPTIEDRVHGAIAVQFKIKVW